MSDCLCSAKGANLGLPACEVIAKYTSGLIFVPLLKADGTRNYITAAEITSGLDDTFVDAKINNTDLNLRWSFLQDIKNIDSVRAESLYKDYDDGSKVFIRKGVKAMNFLLSGKKASVILAGKLEAWACIPFGVYRIDIDGNIAGEEITGNGDLYPFQIDSDSLTVITVDAKGNTPAETMISMNLHVAVQDKRMRQIASANVTAALLLKNGLIDAYATITAPDASSYVADGGLKVVVYTSFGALGAKIPVTGLVSADFVSIVADTASKIRRTNNTPGDVSITSVTESPDGTYRLASAAPTAGDTWVVKVKKTGYDASTIDDIIVTAVA